MASLTPVEAPEGTMAWPMVPSASVTSTATVGLPRESSTSLAFDAGNSQIHVNLRRIGPNVLRLRDGRSGRDTRRHFSQAS